MKALSLITAIAALALASCAAPATSPTPAAPSAYKGKVVLWGMEITKQDGSPVSKLRTELPFVEDWEFINGGTQVVTTSRARHGAAMVELFDTATGARRDGIKAYQIRKGRPAWAAPHAE